jgi:hypothetical protein
MRGKLWQAHLDAALGLVPAKAVGILISISELVLGKGHQRTLARLDGQEMGGRLRQDLSKKKVAVLILVS